MWDGRETFPDPASSDCILGSTSASRRSTSISPTRRTAPRSGMPRRRGRLPHAQREAIVAFETTLFTAQVFDDEAGELTARRRARRPGVPEPAEFLFRHQRRRLGRLSHRRAVQPERIQLYDAWNTHRPWRRRRQPRRGAPCRGPRRDAVQYQAYPDHGRQGPQRRPERPRAAGHLHHLPRHA